MTRKKSSEFTIETLQKHHDRSSFSCGIDELDNYLKHQAGQDHRRRVSAPFVLLDQNTSDIAGYYTLAMTGINLKDIPEKLAKKLPRYPVIPAVLLGRLAVDNRYQNRKLGEYLLVDAMKRSLDHSSDIAAFCFVVDAINDQAKSFYKKYEFIEMPRYKNRLYLPLNTIEKLGL